MRRVNSHPGFALLELLVVLAILSLLASLSLSAIYDAREAARRVQCRNNLRQIGLGIQSHLDVHRHYPTDGWGYRWIGDVQHGFGERQPGGWVFNLLPYIEQNELRNLASGGTQADPRWLQTPLTLMHCPSRRKAANYAWADNPTPINAPKLPDAAKCDYAINAGDIMVDANEGPDSDSDADLKAYKWPDLRKFTGIAFVRSRTRDAEVVDGTSNTYLVGEKSVSQDRYEDGGSAGDDQVMFVGDDADVRRWTTKKPVADWTLIDDKERFGAPHEQGCHFLFCDGSVRFVSYQIDLQTHKDLGNRHDGHAVRAP